MSDKITKEDAQIWANALRSGEYKQGKYSLQKKDTFCCLGVACDVFIPADKLILTPSGEIDGRVPYQQINAPEWLGGVNRDFRDKTGDNIFALNDNLGYTFDEIADLIELVYVHEAL